jgi:hypothetical protein
MNLKDFLFRHIEKFVFVVALCYLIYTTIHTLVILKREAYEIDTKLQLLSGTIDRKLRIEMPPAIDVQLKEAEQMELRLTAPPDANILQRPLVFRGPSHERIVLYRKIDDLPVKEIQVEAPVPDTELIFRGGTAKMALIQIRKLYNDMWWIKSFTVEKGKVIGEKATIKREVIDFDTHCKLVEIIPLAQKPMTLKKTNILQDEKGNFSGILLTEEIQMVSTPKIVFECREGKSYGLWIGESVNLSEGTVTAHVTTNALLTN